MISYRQTYTTEHLTEEDFIRGIGFDSSLLYKLIVNKRTNENVTFEDKSLTWDMF